MLRASLSEIPGCATIEMYASICLHGNLVQRYVSPNVIGEPDKTTSVLVSRIHNAILMVYYTCIMILSYRQIKNVLLLFLTPVADAPKQES